MSLEVLAFDPDDRELITPVRSSMRTARPPKLDIIYVVDSSFFVSAGGP
jgi:hypothetical protein